jgi:NAD(P)-dependent dehydrogenase (short-subunit alcohol dehydrogenase family)
VADGRTVLVGGGSGALGRAVCLAFLADGARVVATARRAAELAALAAAAGAAGGRLSVIAADLGAPAEAARAVEEAGPALAAVVNTVGGWAGCAPVAAEPPERLGLMWQVNVATAHALARAAIPALARRGGAFVQISSAGAAGPQPGQADYAAAKAAVTSLCLSLAEEVRKDGVRVNVILPGTMDTDANRAAMPGADRSGWVRTDDVARVAVFLCSEAARAVTGAAIPVR